MPRINVEDSLFKDYRFFELLQKLGGMDAALGSVVRAWVVAQKYWVINKIGIPLDVWKSQKLRPELIEVGLAETRGEFIYISGSEEQFAWLESAQKKGIRSGEVRRLNSLNNSSNPVQASSTSSSSSSSSSKTKNNTYTHEGLKSCIQEYQTTLDKYSIPRKATASEARIASLGQRYGFEDLKLAIAGMRCEKRSDKFNPADWISLERLTAKNFERFLNLGAKNAKRESEASMGDGPGPSRQDNPGPTQSTVRDPNLSIADLLKTLRRDETA